MLQKRDDLVFIFSLGSAVLESEKYCANRHEQKENGEESCADSSSQKPDRCRHPQQHHRHEPWKRLGERVQSERSRQDAATVGVLYFRMQNGDQLISAPRVGRPLPQAKPGSVDFGEKRLVSSSCGRQEKQPLPRRRLRNSPEDGRCRALQLHPDAGYRVHVPHQ